MSEFVSVDSYPEKLSSLPALGERIDGPVVDFCAGEEIDLGAFFRMPDGSLRHGLIL